MNNSAFDLFMITTNLSQLKERDRVISLFIESITSIFPDIDFSWSDNENPAAKHHIEVCTINACYGFINYSTSTQPSDTTFALIHNACQMLGLILERIKNDQQLVSQNLLLKQIAEERMKLAEEMEQRVKERTIEIEQNKEEIIRKNGLLSILLETISVGIFMVEVPSGKPLVANEAAFKILGRGILPDANEKNLGEVYNAFKADSQTPYPLDEMPIVLGMRGITSHVDDMVIIRPDDSQRLLEVFGAPVTDSIGNTWASIVTFIDITDRKKTENALRETEELFSLFMSHSPIYAYIKEVSPENSTVLQASDNFNEMIGIPGKDMTGKSMYELFPDEFARNMIKDDWKVVSDGNVLKLDEEFNEHYYTTVKFPISHGDKNLLAGYTIDITDRKSAEITLLESEKRYRNVLETVSLLSVMLDINGNITLCNNFLLNLTGWTHEEIIGKNWFDIFIPEKFKEFMKFDIFQKSIANGDLPEHFENEIITKNEEIRLIAWNNIVNRDNNGKIVGITSIGEDITDRKRTEEALRESEQHFRTLANSGQALIWTAGLDKKCNYFNQQWMNFSGRTLEEELGDGWVELVHPDDLDYCFNTYSAAFNKREQFSMVYRMRRHDGEYRYIQDDGSPRYSSQGEFLGYIGYCMDITNKKNAEEAQRLLEQQIQQTQKLESLGVLAGGIAHDFNNILMAVLGYAELAQMEISPLSPARGSIGNIITGAHRAAELCRQMLAYSGKATFAMEKLNLGELVEEMTHLLKTSISKKALLNLHIDRSTPQVKADASQMRQIVMNLIINASDAIGERSGVISVSVGATRCNEEYLQATELYNVLQTGLYVHIEVADTGCGMDAETKSRIFEPFFTTKFTGRGLGLAAVMGIVRAHNGAMKVYSEVNKGTTFKVLIPAIEVEKMLPANDIINVNSNWKGSGTILFVDDEESIRAIGAQMLELMGYNVLTAEDGREAVEIYKKRGHEIDLVIMDMTMPHLDGAEAFSELRMINPDVKVILASGYSKEDIGARFAGKGLVGVLQKPFTVGVLRELLQSVNNDGV